MASLKVQKNHKNKKSIREADEELQALERHAALSIGFMFQRKNVFKNH